MSKLDELLQQYCPNGVPYKAMWRIIDIGSGYAFSSSSLSESGRYGVVKTTNIQNGQIDITKMQYVDDVPMGYEILPGTVLLGLSGTIKAGRNQTDEIFYLNQRVARFIPSEVIEEKYLYYIIMQYADKLANLAGGNTVKNLSVNDLRKVEIPVLPLFVQQEIVRILDKFTELEAELTAELTARKQQYEYYRDALLPFDEADVEWKPLGDICTIVRGASPRPIKNFITEDSDGVNWIKIGDVAPGAKYITDCAEKITFDGAKKSRFVKPGDFILSNSMSFGRPYILQIEGCIHDGWLAISDFDDYLTSDYLYHILTSTYIQKVMKQRASFGGAVQNLNADIVRTIEIPVIDKDRQKEVVRVLDHFSLLCSDISSGLPAEIAARQKQYEYYRDKLLSFKEV